MYSIYSSSYRIYSCITPPFGGKAYRPPKKYHPALDRRMKKGKPRGKDKGVQASTPPVTVSPAGTQTGKVRRREGGGGEEEREGSQVEEEDKVMKGDRMTPGSTGDHTRTCPATRMRTRLWWHYPPKYRSHHIQRHQNRLTENPGQPRQPPRTSPLAIPEPRG